MPPNMPFRLKDLIRECITQDPKKRPTATQFRERLQEIYQNIGKYTRDQFDMAAGAAFDMKIFKDTNKPEIPPEFISDEDDDDEK